MMSVTPRPPAATLAIACPDDTDQQIVALWLAQRPRTTTRSYRQAWKYLATAADGTALREMRLPHLQAFVHGLCGLKVSSQVTYIAAIQSLFSFACKIGYLTTNFGRLLKRPKSPLDVARRLVNEADIQRLLATTDRPRDATLFRLAYVTGLRVAELSSLTWRSFAARETGAVLSVIGKGDRLRHIFVPEAAWAAILTLRRGAADSDPVFVSRQGHALSCNSMHRIAKQAALRAGLPATFSMHWCRHAHASHALDRGAPVHLVQQTLGHVSLATTCRYVHCRPGTSSAQFIAAY